MARNVKMPFSSDDKAKVLRKLQGNIHFEKTLTASSASRNRGRNCGLALPFWFVQKHGDKFRKSVTFRAESSTIAWPVTLSIYLRSPTATQVKFSGGWKAFATFNGLLAGDSLIFSLTAMSEFEVYVFRSTANPKGRFPSVAQRKWTYDSERSRRKAKQSYECRDEQLAAEGSYKDAVKLNGLIVKKETVTDVGAVSASGHSPTSFRNSSCSKDLHLLESENVRDSLSRRHHDSNIKQERGLNHDELIVSRVTGDDAARHTGGRKNSGNKYHGLTFQKITRNSQLPGFLKKLTVSNVCRRDGGGETACLEIPLDFWKIYGSRLHSLVKLQGIREESQVRTMACLPTHGKPSRHYLRAEWRDFANENNLEVGQELLFTHAADSFFVVRELLPHPERSPKIESL